MALQGLMSGKSTVVDRLVQQLQRLGPQGARRDEAVTGCHVHVVLDEAQQCEAVEDEARHPTDERGADGLVTAAPTRCRRRARTAVPVDCA